MAPAREYHSTAAKARAEQLHDLGHEIFFIKVLSNLVITATVIIWCVFPPSIIVALSCVITAQLVGMAKNLFVKQAKERSANQLQRALNTNYKNNELIPKQDLSKVKDEEIANLKNKLLETEEKITQLNTIQFETQKESNLLRTKNDQLEWQNALLTTQSAQRMNDFRDGTEFGLKIKKDMIPRHYSPINKQGASNLVIDTSRSLYVSDDESQTNTSDISYRVVDANASIEEILNEPRDENDMNIEQEPSSEASVAQFSLFRTASPSPKVIRRNSCPNFTSEENNNANTNTNSHSFG